MQNRKPTRAARAVAPLRPSALAIDLAAAGVRLPIAIRLEATYGEERCRRQLDWIRWRPRVDDTGAYLRCAIVDDYPEPRARKIENAVAVRTENTRRKLDKERAAATAVRLEQEREAKKKADRLSWLAERPADYHVTLTARAQAEVLGRISSEHRLYAELVRATERRLQANDFEASYA